MNKQQLFEKIKHSPLPTDPRFDWFEREDWKFGASEYANLGCRFGARGPYWELWLLLITYQGEGINAALSALPIKGSRWVALWARENGRAELFLTAYQFFLEINEPGKIGPIAHENSWFFEELYRREQYSRIAAIAQTLFQNIESEPGRPGYLYENAWKVLALVGSGDVSRAMSEADALVRQFPGEGSSWISKALAEKAVGNLVPAEAAWSKALECSYIDPGLERIAHARWERK